MINEIISEINGKNIVEQLKFFAEKFNGSIVFSTSFQFEDQVITDAIFSNNINIEIFTIDTGRHFEETYKTLNKTINKYKKQIKIFFPDYQLVEELVSKKGPMSFYESVENRKECCNIRKVEPLKRALKNKKCWITGLRAGQAETRTNLHAVEFNNEYNLVKFNPLIDWTFEEVKEYIKNNNVPYNVLQDKGFLSIGCEPCTRAVKEGEDIRAGRWWWEDNSKKECGLHLK